MSTSYSTLALQQARSAISSGEPVYDYVNHTSLTDTGLRIALKEALGQLSRTALTKMRDAVATEKNICTGTWVATNGEEINSGCLFTAAYMQTDKFAEQLRSLDCSLPQALSNLQEEIEGWGSEVIANELETDQVTVDNVITLFDWMGGRKHDVLTYTYDYGWGPEAVDQAVITKSQRKWILKTIDSILE